MTPDERREILMVLAELWALSPDVRLGQLFAHLGFLGEAHLEKGLGYIDDDELLAVMYRHRTELIARSMPLPPPDAGVAASVSGSSMSPQPLRPQPQTAIAPFGQPG